MAKTAPITVDHLWQMERLGVPSLSPDGAQAVVSLTSASMDDNKTRSALWLLSTLGGAPRRQSPLLGLEVGEHLALE